VRVDLADGRQALIQLNIGYPLAVLAVSGQAAPNYQNRAAFDSFGVPTYSGDNVGSAFKAKVHSRSPKQKLGTGVDLGVFARAPYGKMFLLTREGARAPGAGGLRFSSFDDPLMNDQFAIAFPASLDNAPSGLNKGIWWRQPGGQLQLVAIAGGQPAGVANGAAWSGFQSVALPDGLASGPVFTAKLYVPAWSEPNPAAITRSNNTGIWGVDSTGALWLLARTGSTINVGGKNRVIKTLTALSAVSGSCGQSRSYNSSGEVIYRAAFTDGGQAVIKVALP
jgi:hypothetical protein